ncbi:MAG: gamma-glutamyl-gamma-aminobutyrate hydrolase family protein [Anaerolineae bacterium]|nr:gamma-glutamyl-gamma-aminobutyrate hydrolase family protein [Anaerolineae bacterium]
MLSTSMHAVGATYTRAVQRAGGTPVIVPPVMHETDWPVLLERLDGLLLTGGEDIAPARYGQALEPWTGLVDDERDYAELGLVRAWLALGKPVLAICRGHQLLNVALGGTLYQDIMAQVANTFDHAYVPGRPMEDPVHDVAIESDSALARILGGERFAVNSAHHQATWLPGQGLEIVARAPDGIVEAAELRNHPFCLSVQWHPEAMLKLSDTMLPLFDALIAAAR